MERIEELKNVILSLKKGGSGIHIKKANRGKFTDYCGGKVTSECIARGKASSNPTIRKRATFAANARKWKHENGGSILLPKKFQYGGSMIYGQNPEITDDDLIYNPLAINKQPELTVSDNAKYPVESVKIVKPKPIQDTQVLEQPAEIDESTNTSNNSIDWTENDIKVLNSDGSNRDKQRVTNKYLQEKLGLTREQAAALVGIWQAESNFNLNAANQEEKAGKNNSVKSSQYGIGIGQWTNSRHDDFVNYINANGGKNNLKTQLDFAINEINTKYSDFLSNLRSASNIKDATAYAYVQYVGANEKNIKDLPDLYARVNKTVNRYRKKHLELYGKATNGFEQRLKFANDSLNIS